LLLFFTWLTGGMYTLLMAYAVVFIHEVFHVLAALLVRERIGSILILPFGMTLRLASAMVRETDKEIVIAAAGPLSNGIMLVLLGALFPTYGFDNPALLFFAFINALTLFLNLLPCLPLDGGRIVKAILVRRIGCFAASAVMKRISRLITVLLFVGGIFLLILTKMNISLLLVAGFLAFHISEEERQNEIHLMREVLHSKEKLIRKGLMRTRTVCVLETTQVGDVFKLFSYDCFYIIYIVDAQQSVLSVVTETEVVEVVMQYGWGITLSKVPLVRKAGAGSIPRKALCTGKALGHG